MKRLMIASELPTILATGRDIMSDLGFCGVEAVSTLSALAQCEARLPDILIVDADLPDALTLISNIRLLDGGKLVLIYYCTASADLRRLMAGKHAGADNILLKPFDRKTLGSLFGHLAIAA